MNLVSEKEISIKYGVSGNEIRKSIKTHTFDWIKENGKILIDIDSFRESKFHIEFNYRKLISIYENNVDLIIKRNEIYDDLKTTEMDDYYCELYSKMFYDIQSDCNNHIISNLERKSFTKTDYDDYLLSIRNKINDYLNDEYEVDYYILSDMLGYVIPLISEELFLRYPSYYDKNFLLRIIDDIKNHKYLNNKENTIVMIYFQFLEFGVNKCLEQIIDEIDFNEYEKIFFLMNESKNRFTEKILLDGDERYFSNVRDMFIF